MMIRPMREPDARVDAVVVGAGHNGLACALVLARAGWDVLVAERASSPGGAVRTEEVTLPGFRHDLFATNLNLFAGSPFFAEFGEELEVEFAHSARPFASVFPSGRSITVSTDWEATRASIGAVSPGDAERWLEAAQRFDRIAPHLLPLLGAPMPSVAAVRALRRGRRALGKAWPYELARLALQSPRELAEEHFESDELRSLVAAWGMHLDFAPDVSGGAIFPFLETFASARHGMVLGKGGASAMIDGLMRACARRGVRVELDSEVSAIEVDGGRAVGVVLGSGARVLARRAVVANLAPRLVFDALVASSAVPSNFLRDVRRFRHGPGTMMIHVALDELPSWTASPALQESAYVHATGGLGDMSLAYAQAQSGLLPAAPALIVGQPTVVDPGRAPEGKHVLWLQVRMVPSTIVGDAGDQIDATDWDEAKEPFADRVLAQLEAYAPGLSASVLGRHVLSPLDLERYNPNLIGGDSLGGSHHAMQYFFLRPVPGWSRYRTPVDSLYLCGASTWPGAGVGAGYMLGTQLVGSRVRRALRRRPRRAER